MTKENTVDRRRFLTAAGAAVAGAGAVSTLTRSASAQNVSAGYLSVLTIRKQADIPYNPDVLVVGGGPAGIGAALGAAGKGVNRLPPSFFLGWNHDGYCAVSPFNTNFSY